MNIDCSQYKTNYCIKRHLKEKIVCTYMQKNNYLFDNYSMLDSELPSVNIIICNDTFIIE